MRPIEETASNSLRRRNRRVAWSVLGLMLGFATIATGFILATQDYRRAVDQVRPDLPSRWAGAALVVGAATAISLIGYLGWRWRSATTKNESDIRP